MKSTEVIALSLGATLAAFSAYTQGAFQDLDFESATPSTPINGPVGPYYHPISLALPGWTGYFGSDPQSQVTQNTYGHGEAEIDLFGPNYPAAGPSPGINPGTIDGNYSVLLQAGLSPDDNTSLVSASIAQTGTIPLGAESMQFRAWQTYYTEFTVSFNGNNLSPVVLGTGANYTLYGVSIPPAYDGQSVQLEFTADYVNPGASWLGLDDIAFSPAAVPEPSPLILMGVGGFLFALHRRFAPRRP